MGKLLCKNQETNFSYCSNFGPQVSQHLTLCSHCSPTEVPQQMQGWGWWIIYFCLPAVTSVLHREELSEICTTKDFKNLAMLDVVFMNSAFGQLQSAPHPSASQPPLTGYTPNIHCSFLPLDLCLYYSYCLKGSLCPGDKKIEGRFGKELSYLDFI